MKTEPTTPSNYSMEILVPGHDTYKVWHPFRSEDVWVLTTLNGHRIKLSVRSIDKDHIEVCSPWKLQEPVRVFISPEPIPHYSAIKYLEKELADTKRRLDNHVRASDELLELCRIAREKFDAFEAKFRK